MRENIFYCGCVIFLAMTQAETAKEKNVGTCIVILEGTLGEGGLDSIMS